MPAGEITNGAKIAIAAGALLVVALGYLNWSITHTGIEVSPISPARNPGPGATQAKEIELVGPLDGKPLDAFSETVQRPLFNRDRKPVAKKETAPAGVADVPVELRLIGVVRANGERSRALIRFANESLGKWLVEGEEANGWTLRAVNEQSVIVERHGQPREIELKAPGRPAEQSDPAEPRPPPR